MRDLVLTAVFWVITTILITRLVKHVGRILVAINGQTAESKRAGTLLSIISKCLIGVIWAALFLGAAMQIGVPDTALTMASSIFAAAIGFGAQSIVKDFALGLVSLMEKQVSLHDIVTADLMGQSVKGEVVSISIRSLTIASFSGETVNVPFGSIIMLRNHTSVSGKFTLDLPVEDTSNLNATSEVIGKTLEGFRKNDPTIHSLKLLGINNVKDSGGIEYRILGETSPGNQDEARRKVLHKLFTSLQEAHAEDQSR